MLIKEIGSQIVYKAIQYTGNNAEKIEEFLFSNIGVLLRFRKVFDYLEIDISNKYDNKETILKVYNNDYIIFDEFEKRYVVIKYYIFKNYWNILSDDTRINDLENYKTKIESSMKYYIFKVNFSIYHNKSELNRIECLIASQYKNINIQLFNHIKDTMTNTHLHNLVYGEEVDDIKNIKYKFNKITKICEAYLLNSNKRIHFPISIIGEISLHSKLELYEISTENDKKYILCENETELITNFNELTEFKKITINNI